MTENRPLSHYFYLLFLSSVWGCSFLFLKILAPLVPPMTIAASRISIGAIVILIYVLLIGGKLPTHKSIWIKGTVIGLVGTGIPFTLISWSMQYLNSGTGAICMSVIPLMVFVMAHFVHADEKMSWKGLFGILSGICGIMVLFYDSLTVEQSNTFIIYALCAMLFASFGYALANIMVKKYVKTEPINTSFVMLTTSSLFLWPFAFIYENPLSIDYGMIETLSIFYLGVLPTGITTMVMVIFTQKAGSTFVSYNTYLIPLVGVFAGYIFLDESLKQATLLSILFIAIGIYVAQTQKKAVKYTNT